MGDAGQIRFRSRMRFWDETKGAGLAVVDGSGIEGVSSGA